MRSFEPSTPPHRDVSRVLVTAEQIDARVGELAGEVTAAYAGRDLAVVTVLTGSLMFTADLVRALNVRVRIEPVSVTSYPGRSTESRGCTFRLPPGDELTGCDVLIVDDIYDSGRTMEYLTEAIRPGRPSSIASCVLLNKARPDLSARPGRLDWYGFDIPDEFVVGYGLDFDGLYRNLPYIGVLAEHAREGR